MTVTGVEALDALRAAVEECKIGRESWMPVGDGEYKHTVTFAGVAPVAGDTLATLPGVTVLARGWYLALASHCRLIEVDGEQWVALSDASGTILNPGDRWDGMVARGLVSGV